MAAEPLVAEQLEILLRANKALFGIASLRPNASSYSDGVFDGRRPPALLRRRRCGSAGCALHRRMGTAGRRRARRSRDRLVSRRPPSRRPAHLRGRRVRQSAGDPRGASPRLSPMCWSPTRPQRAASCALTAQLNSTGARRDKQAVKQRAHQPRHHVKKFINEPDAVVEEMLEGAIRAHRAFLQPLPDLETRAGGAGRTSSRQGRPCDRRRVGPRAVFSRIRRQGPRRRRRGRQHLLDAAARSDLSMRKSGVRRGGGSVRLRKLRRRRHELRHGRRDRPRSRHRDAIDHDHRRRRPRRRARIASRAAVWPATSSSSRSPARPATKAGVSTPARL